MTGVMPRAELGSWTSQGDPPGAWLPQVPLPRHSVSCLCHPPATFSTQRVTACRSWCSSSARDPGGETGPTLLRAANPNCQQCHAPWHGAGAARASFPQGRGGTGGM